MNIEQIARITHETNRAYCQALGDNSQAVWEDAPEWQRRSAIKGVLFHLLNHVKGVAPSPSASHDAWLAEKRADGWVYGPVKDPEKKEHPCFVPYNELPIEQRMKDYLFGAVVDVFAKCENFDFQGAPCAEPSSEQLGQALFPEMPRYRSHKEVRALRIKQVVVHEPASGTDCRGGFIFPEETRQAPIQVDADWLHKHNPQPGGYYVVYADGYASYSPAQAFEEGYTRI